MENKTIIIIGAGMAGLAAGCYLQMNGYKTKIFELSAQPGGLCTGWKRKDFYFDGCISWLVGSGPKHFFHKFWKELNVIQKMNFIYEDEFAVVYLKDGQTFTLYDDVDKLEQEFLRIAPEDGEIIKILTDGIRVISEADLKLDKAMELFTQEDFIEFKNRAGKYLEIMGRWGEVTIEEFVQRFKSPYVRENFRKIFFFNRDTSITYFMATMGWRNAKTAGYPEEGSLELSKIVRNRYKSLGGEIYYNSKVSEILVEEDKAVGIKLENSQVYYSDRVISAADGYSTIYKMLKGHYVDEDIQFCYDNLKPCHPQIYVGLGINKTFEDLPHYLSLELDKPLDTGDFKVETLYVKIYNRNRSYAPDGKTSVIVYGKTSHDYWDVLKRENPQQYYKEKAKFGEKIIEVLENRFGNIASNVEVVDVSTPNTIKRYTNNQNGSWMGWEKHMDNILHKKKLKKTLPGLDRFFMIGHWTEVGGGLPTVLVQSRNLVQLICAADGIEFETIIEEPAQEIIKTTSTY